MDSGELVGDDLVGEVVRDRLEQHDWNYGFIVDGFPRNAPQAAFFLERYDIDGVIDLVMPDEEVHRRVLARRLCSVCGLDYNLIAHRPGVADTCDVCGGKLVARPDDNPEALAAAARRLPRQDGTGDRAVRAQGVRRHDRRHEVEGRRLRRHLSATRPAGLRLTTPTHHPP